MGALAAGAMSAQSAEEWVKFSDNGHRIEVNVDGVAKFHAQSSVVFNVDGKGKRLHANQMKLVNPITQSVVSTPFGDAEMSTVTLGTEGYEYTIRLKKLKDLKAFTVQGVIHNRSDKDIKLNAFDLFDTSPHARDGGLVNDADQWLVTPMMRDAKAQPLSEFEGRTNESAMFYRNDGEGFLVGPVGPAEAHATIEVRKGIFKAVVGMDGVLVKAGESRRSEEMIFSFESAKTSTDVWTRWVAETHGVRRHRGPVYGWCSWYDRTTKIDAAHVLEVTKTIKENPNTFGKGIIQIDDGYQKMDGDWSANDKFPMGMAAVAQEVREAGCIPGVWFAPLMIHPDHPWAKENPDAIQKDAGGLERFMNPNPFHPAGAKWIVPDHPASKKFLFNVIRDARERGYGYIKIDFNGIGNKYYDPTKTRLQIFRELYTLYREAAGEEMYILSCLGSPTRGVIGFIDAARVGPDSHPAGFEHCLDSVLRFQQYDNVWWQNDPDVSYLAPKLKSRRVGYTPQGEGMWRSWHAINALVGGTAMISEPIQFPDVKEKWRNYEIMRPGSAEPARLLELGNSPHNSTLGFAAQRTFGDFAVYNLYNVTEGSKPLTLDFKAAGLPKGVNCAVYDFWENKVIGYATDSHSTKPLEYLSSALLRFTPITSDRPTLVGSDLHLSIGATEVENILVSPSAVTVVLTDAGAQEGTLTFHSKQKLVADQAQGCKVDAVESLGDNLWQVKLSGRQWGKAQSVKLGIRN